MDSTIRSSLVTMAVALSCSARSVRRHKYPAHLAPAPDPLGRHDAVRPALVPESIPISVVSFWTNISLPPYSHDSLSVPPPQPDAQLEFSVFSRLLCHQYD